ncbi:hypothetical protein HJG60_009483 [Phyllostomus discolor]|uniref:Uncharacterized protein n=1 Tax=Phyllostomus discolor TaxID=89673 RepID=A0A834D8Z0_9CHIR|nr:hypothetical protein HJG60_009483 [Phyllostomus discolor]
MQISDPQFPFSSATEISHNAIRRPEGGRMPGDRNTPWGRDLGETVSGLHLWLSGRDPCVVLPESQLPPPPHPCCLGEKTHCTDPHRGDAASQPAGTELLPKTFPRERVHRGRGRRRQLRTLRLGISLSSLPLSASAPVMGDGGYWRVSPRAGVTFREHKQSCHFTDPRMLPGQLI